MKLLTLSLATTASAAAVAASISKGTGFGTYYYDVEQPQACGTDLSNQNKGYVECSFTQPLPLDQMHTNYLVAMNHTELKGNLDKYCGKRVVVTVNGTKSGLPLFIGDGCERCGGGQPNGAWDAFGAPGLDFSFSVLSQLSPQACAAGHVDISWEIVDERLHQFNTH